MLQKTILVISIGKNINYISVLIHSSDFINCRLDRGPIKPQDRLKSIFSKRRLGLDPTKQQGRLKSIFRRPCPISNLYLLRLQRKRPTHRSAPMESAV